jgi:hypothetical protein
MSPNEFWGIIFCVCTLTPGLGFGIGWLFRGAGYRRKAIYYISAYYSAVFVLHWRMSVHEVQILVIPWITLFFGAAVVGLAFVMFGYISSIQRRRVGICHKCGYDIRACADARCSECGAPFAPWNLDVGRQDRDRESTQ